MRFLLKSVVLVFFGAVTAVWPPPSRPSMTCTDKLLFISPQKFYHDVDQQLQVLYKSDKNSFFGKPTLIELSFKSNNNGQCSTQKRIKSDGDDDLITEMIPFNIPVGLGNSLTVEITIKDSQGDTISKKKSSIYVVNAIPSLILTEFSKPQYRPGETMKLRLVRLFSDKVFKVTKSRQMQCNQMKDIKKKKSNELEVTIHDPLGTLRKKIKGLQNKENEVLEYILMADAKEGDWSIEILEKNGQKTYLRIPVKHFVLPTFDVAIKTISTPLLMHTQEKTSSEDILHLEICLQHPAQERKIFATAKVHICHCGSNLTGSKLSKYCKPPLVPTMSRLSENCKEIEIRIKEKCGKIKENLSKWRNHGGYLDGVLSAFVTVVNDSNDQEIEKSIEIKPKVVDTKVIELVSEKSEDLPLWVKLDKKNKRPNTFIVLEDKSDPLNKISYEIKNTTEEFVFPPLKGNAILYIEQNQDGENSKILEKLHLYDKNTENLSSWPRSIITLKTNDCPNYVELKLVSKFNLKNKKLYFQSQTLLSNMFQSFAISDRACIARDDHFGHYSCDEKGRIVCHSGWYGSNCLQKQCKDECDDKQTFYIYELKIDLRELNAPELRGMVYYIDENLDITSTPILVNGLHSCLSPLNRATTLNKDILNGGFYFDPSDTEPGKAINLNIIYSANTHAPDDVCFITAYDKSLLSLQDQENSMKSPMQRYIDTYEKAYGMRKIETSKNLNVDSFSLAGLQLHGKCNNFDKIYYYSPGPRFSLAMNNGRSSHQRSNDFMKFKSSPAVTRIRDFFPESWIFSSENVRVIDSQLNITGVKIDLKAPDSITTWESGAFCVSESNGVYIPDRLATLNVAQPFYIEFNLPNKMVRNEVMHLNVAAIVNDENLRMENNHITLRAENNGNWSFLSKTELSFCVSPDIKTDVQSFILKPNTFGKVNFTVYAEAEINSVKCGNNPEKSSKFLSDAVTRPIRVVFEGEPKEKMTSSIVCLSDNEELAISKELVLSSKSLVSDSLRLYTGVTGDILSLPASNLEKLVRMPTGCGEQNMIIVAPSVSTLQYLSRKEKYNSQGLKSNEEELRDKARSFIKKGFTRELKYRHPDGSFSAFGTRDSHGSTWLTSFVLGTFAEASEFTKDSNILDIFNDGVAFLQKMSDPNVCFLEKGNVIHKEMQGFKDQRSKTIQKSMILTSHILTTLYTIKNKNVFNKSALIKHLDNLIENTENCIARSFMPYLFEGLDLNVGTLPFAQLIYAISLSAESTNILMHNLPTLKNKFISLMTSKDGMNFWKDEANTREENIQLSSYGFLSLRPELSLDQQLRHIKWLINQQSGSGGYYSTQDTVLALKALSWFTLPEISENVMITPSLGKNRQIFNLNKKNIDVYQQLPLRQYFNYLSGTSHVDWSIESPKQQGCIQLMSRLLFNEKRYKSSASRKHIPFLLDLSVEFDEKESCDAAKVNFCIKSNADFKRSTGMLLVRIEPPTGFETRFDDLKRQVVRKEGAPKRTDLNENDDGGDSVSIYFDGLDAELDTEKRCAIVHFDRTMVIDELQPGSISVMDYYDTEQNVSLDLEFNCSK